MTISSPPPSGGPGGRTSGQTPSGGSRAAAGLRCEYNSNLKIPWTKYIPKITESYNETVHTITGFTPRFLYNGIQPQYIEHDTETHTPIEKARKLPIKRTTKIHEHGKKT
ncbi:hypothetical protein LAZ67_6002427 [Cordylochernes scorpioides]|uniref:Integrase catalytic domain-containing protein n=1 Tax=Cordylochernes scorpioides TaxID=51811 RepID=A0ABY6KPQ7_9ARAC|nr:hypothetical protein LAZ67_6002427 [Cordylochernes scorpioides]